MKKIILIITTMGILLLSACQRLCSVAPFTMELNLQDTETNDLIGTQLSTSYNLDSIYLFYMKDNIPTTMHYQIRQKNYHGKNFNFLGEIDLQNIVINQNISTIYLHLNSNTIDTLTIKAHKVGNCPNVHEVDEFKINNIDCLHQSQDYIIIGNKKYLLRIL